MPSSKTFQRWVEAEEDLKRPRIEPWVFFGITLILTVGALFFAGLTWAIRTHQTTVAVNHARSLGDELQTTKDELAEVIARSESLHERVEKLSQSEVALQRESRSLGGELEAVKRELDAVRDDLTACKRMDRNPSSLPHASVADVLAGLDTCFVTVFVDDSHRRVRLSEGALLEYVKQWLRRAGLQVADASPVEIVVSVVAAAPETGPVSLSVSVQVHQVWKTPGEPTMRPVAVWSSHSAGLTSVDRTASFIEEMIDGLLRDFVAVRQQ